MSHTCPRALVCGAGDATFDGVYEVDARLTKVYKVLSYRKVSPALEVHGKTLNYNRERRCWYLCLEVVDGSRLEHRAHYKAADDNEPTRPPTSGWQPLNKTPLPAPAVLVEAGGEGLLRPLPMSIRVEDAHVDGKSLNGLYIEDQEALDRSNRRGYRQVGGEGLACTPTPAGGWRIERGGRAYLESGPSSHQRTPPATGWMQVAHVPSEAYAICVSETGALATNSGGRGHAVRASSPLPRSGRHLV